MRTHDGAEQRRRCQAQRPTSRGPKHTAGQQRRSDKNQVLMLIIGADPEICKATQDTLLLA